MTKTTRMVVVVEELLIRHVAWTPGTQNVSIRAFLIAAHLGISCASRCNPEALSIQLLASTSLARTMTLTMTQPRLALLLKAGHLNRVETMTVAVKTPTLMTRTVTGERSAETRKEKSFPVPPKVAEKMAEMAAEKMAIPPILTTRTAEGKSAETRKEKSFPVPEKVAVKTPILMTRTVTNGERSPKQKVM
jgi:hypothetical protein